MSYIIGLVMGSLACAMALFGILIVSPIQSQWMHFPFAFITFCSSILLIALGVTINTSGLIAFSVIDDYCSNNF
jgi:hypothetical protein